MSEEVKRPKAGNRKIHHKSSFEFCYLRHQYLRRTKTNPTKDEMKPYQWIVEHMAKNTFYTYKNLFNLVGFDVSDLIAIGNIQLISFLGLFSLDKMPEKYNDFIKLYKKINDTNPDQKQILNKNKANYTLFLKQRMEDVVRVCRQKARNIKGLPTEEYFFYCGQNKPPKILKDLIDKYEKFGYKKIDQAVYKSIRKKANIHDNQIFRFNNLYYIAVSVDQKYLQLSDFISAGQNPYDNIHNKTPEEIYFSLEDDIDFKKNKEEFYNKTKSSKAEVIRQFIEKNKKNIMYRDEVSTARKMLKNLL